MTEKKRLSGGFHNEIFYFEGKIERISEVKKTKEMIIQELEWMDFLYQKGVSVPKPDMKLETVEGRVVTYFAYVDGEPVDVTNETLWNANKFYEYGKILGKMHALSKEYPLEVIHRPTWTAENTDVFQIKEHLNSEIGIAYERWMEELSSFEKSIHTYGLIHNDFHQGNLILKKDGTITIIDFDECSYNWFAHDIAVFFYHAFWQQESFNGETVEFCKEFLHHFFRGYQAENILHEDMIKQIPIFLKLREIFLYQLFLRKWDMESMEEWQQYTLKDLKERIINGEHYAGIHDFSRFVKKL